MIGLSFCFCYPTLAIGFSIDHKRNVSDRVRRNWNVLVPVTLIVWFQKISIPPPLKTLCFAPLNSLGFSVPMGSLITSPLPHSPQEFPEFLNRDFLPPSEIQSGFGTSKRRKWILTQLWNTVKFYYNSVNFCQAHYSRKVLAASPSNFQSMSVLFLCNLISWNIWVVKLIVLGFCNLTPAQALWRELKFHSLKQLCKW